MTKSKRTKEPLVDILKIVKIVKPHKFPGKIGVIYLVTSGDLMDVNFPTLAYENQELVALAGILMKGTAFAQGQIVETEKIDQVMMKVSKHYNVASYHNFSHGFSVFLVSTS